MSDAEKRIAELEKALQVLTQQAEYCLRGNAGYHSSMIAIKERGNAALKGEQNV